MPSGTREGGEAGVSRGGLRSHPAAPRFRSELSESTPGGVRDPDGAQTREGFRARPGGGRYRFCPCAHRLHTDT